MHLSGPDSLSSLFYLMRRDDLSTLKTEHHTFGSRCSVERLHGEANEMGPNIG